MVISLSLSSRVTIPKQLERRVTQYLSTPRNDMSTLIHSMSLNDDNYNYFESYPNLDGIRDKVVLDHQMEETATNFPKSEHSLKISHTSALCIVPPDTDVMVWDNLTRARTDLKDPGLFRWPPHINLLYPFYEIPTTNQQHQPTQETIITTASENSEKSALLLLSQIRKATSQINPFHVSLHTFGCFGGKNRGVLWLYPSSAPVVGEVEPIKQLHDFLQEAFPTLLSKTSKFMPFYPHMTLSHFENLIFAENAKKDQEERWLSCLQKGNKNHVPVSNFNSPSFYVQEIYVLQRQGDDGQFHKVATIPLGKNSITSSLTTNTEEKTAKEQDINNDFIRHVPPKPFLLMPTKEEDWVRAERIKLKERRNRKRRKI
jgi:2'-5' RNA ligase